MVKPKGERLLPRKTRYRAEGGLKGAHCGPDIPDELRMAAAKAIARRMVQARNAGPTSANPHRPARRLEDARVDADEVHAAPKHVPVLVVTWPRACVATGREPLIDYPFDPASLGIEDVQDDPGGLPELEVHSGFALRWIRSRECELEQTGDGVPGHRGGRVPQQSPNVAAVAAPIPPEHHHAVARGVVDRRVLVTRGRWAPRGGERAPGRAPRQRERPHIVAQAGAGIPAEHHHAVTHRIVDRRGRVASDRRGPRGGEHAPG